MGVCHSCLAGIARTTRSQFAFIENPSVDATFNPRIVIRSWKSIPSAVSGVVQFAIARAFDLGVLSCAPFAFSYLCTACRMVSKSSGWVTSTVMSSAYAMTGELRVVPLMWMPGILSSGVHSRGCRQSAKNTILKGKPFLTIHWLGICPFSIPLTCMDAVGLSYKLLIRSMNRLFISYLRSIWNR